MENSPDDPEPLLIKTKEAARLLGISHRKLWTLTFCGEIPSVRIGRIVRYSPQALRDYIQSKTRRREW